jgi:hypothetical protein
MLTKKAKETQAEQSERFRKEAQRLIDAGELSPTEAEGKLYKALDPGEVYLAVTCRSCESPIPLIKCEVDPPNRLPFALLGTRFLISCVNAECDKTHSYAQTEIFPFRWLGKKQERPANEARR